ncbi:hypothetical protein QQF64_016876 [Cirrhinus molitorella]|uniref:Uncharacterized protein n=1 Tax=Cirrhinus molitorella TaxID=172907 RepID=A0ABR3LP51_9TELE
MLPIFPPADSIPRRILGTISSTCCAKIKEQHPSQRGSLPAYMVTCQPQLFLPCPRLSCSNLTFCITSYSFMGSSFSDTTQTKATTPQAFVEAAVGKHNICSPEQQQDPTLLRHVTNSLGLVHSTQIMPKFCPL